MEELFYEAQGEDGTWRVALPPPDEGWVPAGKILRRGKGSAETSALLRDLVKAVESLGMRVGYTYDGNYQHFWVTRG